MIRTVFHLSIMNILSLYIVQLIADTVSRGVGLGEGRCPIILFGEDVKVTTVVTITTCITTLQ